MMMGRLHLKRVLRNVAAFSLTVLLLVQCIRELLSKSDDHNLSSDQKVLNYLSEYMDVHYYVLGNHHDRFHVDLTFMNRGKQMIQKGNWSIYFHHMKYIDTDSFNNAPAAVFTMKHINSYLFRLRPSATFPNLTEDEYVTVRISGGGWVVSRSDVMPNWYVSIDRSNSSQPRVLSSTASEDLSFVSEFDNSIIWKRHKGDLYQPYTPEQRFIKNHVTDMGGAPKFLIPTPVKLTQHSASVTVQTDWKVLCTPDLVSEAEFLSSQLDLAFKTVLTPSVSCSQSILLRVDAALSENENISSKYELYVDQQQNCISITGSDLAGVFYGCQSLLRVLNSPTLPASVPGLHIIDYPRFKYRGLMLDVVRNFFSLKEIMHVIDMLAAYKLNVLHLHLADDEGWRLEIPSLPELTQVGGQRCHDLKETRCIMSMHGSGPFNDTSGTGFYSKADYIELLKYASVRHVKIIPEFDMPGHSHAAIHSMKARYVRLAEKGRVNEGLKYLLSDLGDQSHYKSGQFFTDSAVNPCIQSTYNFIKLVLTELMEMHKNANQPLTRFHFGGDEVPEGAYGGSPSCTEFRRLNPTIKSSKQLKSYFVRRVAQIAYELGIGLQGWEDGFSGPHGGHMPASVLRVPEVVSNAWYHIWGSGNMEGNVYKMANDGYKIVLTSTSHLYFDNPQEPDPEDWGLHWATRYVDTKRTFFYCPDNFYDNIDFGFWGDRLSKEAVCTHERICPPLNKPQNIIGMSGAVWTEEIRTKQRLDQLLWPRMLAVAERAWHKAKWESMEGEQRTEERARDWEEFANTLGYRELSRLEQMGLHLYLPVPGVTLHSGALKANTMFPGLKIQYSKERSYWYDFKPGMQLKGKTFFSTLSPSGKHRSRVIKYNMPAD